MQEKYKDNSSSLRIPVKECYPLILDQEDPGNYHDLLTVMIHHGLVRIATLCLAKNINVSIITVKYSLTC